VVDLGAPVATSAIASAGGPIFVNTASVQVTGTEQAVPYDPSPIPTPAVLSVGGGGNPFGAAPDEELEF
jgi:hypothetical protein